MRFFVGCLKSIWMREIHYFNYGDLLHPEKKTESSLTHSVIVLHFFLWKTIGFDFKCMWEGRWFSNDRLTVIYRDNWRSLMIVTFGGEYLRTCHVHQESLYTFFRWHHFDGHLFWLPFMMKPISPNFAHESTEVVLRSADQDVISVQQWIFLSVCWP